MARDARDSFGAATLYADVALSIEHLKQRFPEQTALRAAQRYRSARHV